MARLAAQPRWPLYLLAFHAYFAFALLFQLYPPLFEPLMREFAVGRQTVSLTMSLFTAPVALFAVPAGLAVDRFSTLRVGWTGFLLMALGAVVSGLAASFPQLLAGRALSGLGGSLVLTAILKVLAACAPRDRLGLALGFFAAGLPAGTGVAFNLLRPLGHRLGWRAPSLAGALVALSALALFHGVMTRQGRRKGGEASSLDVTLVVRHGEMWRIALVTVAAYMAIIAFTTWTPTVLVGYAGIPLWLASALASLLLVVDMPLAPLWGQLSDRLGKRKLFIVTAFAVYLTGSLVVPRIALSPVLAAPGLLLVIGLMGVGCAMFFPAALAIPAETVRAEGAGAAYGMLFTAQVAGMMAGPAVVAAVLEPAGPPLGFLTISLITLAGLLLALTLRTR